MSNNQTALESLIDMGFPRNRAEKALSITGNQGAQRAMDWIFEHMDDPDIDDPYVPGQSHALGKKKAANANVQNEDNDSNVNNNSNDGKDDGMDVDVPADANDAQAKSLVCQDCGKKLRSEIEAQAHAARTQHANFAESVDEIKPLTEEEKQEQAKRLQEKLKLLREERLRKEKEEQLAKEKSRRLQGRDMTQAKKQLEDKEMQKALEAKKREQEEDKRAKERIKALIEADKAARARKLTGASADESPSVPSAGPSAAQQHQQQQQQQQLQSKEYNSANLQIRLTNGNILKNTFDATETLQTVKNYVQMHRNDGAAPFTFMTNFPRKVYNESEMSLTLKEAQLVPSAVLILTKM